MRVEVLPNPNSGEGCDEMEFNVIGNAPPRRVAGIVAEDRGREFRCDLTGVDGAGRFVPAWAVEITDSGEGSAYLITGGAWGLRVRKDGAAWDLADGSQWGEPYKVYSKQDVIFADGEKRSA